MLFNLCQVNSKDLVSQAADGLPQAGKRQPTGKVLDDELLADVFGLEMAEAAPPVKPPAALAPEGKAARQKIVAARKPVANAKTVKAAPGRKAVAGKTPVKATAAPRKTSASKPAELRSSTQAANSPATPIAQAVTVKRASVRPKTKSRQTPTRLGRQAAGIIPPWLTKINLLASGFTILF